MVEVEVDKTTDPNKPDDIVENGIDAGVKSMMLSTALREFLMNFIRRFRHGSSPALDIIPIFYINTRAFASCSPLLAFATLRVIKKMVCFSKGYVTAAPGLGVSASILVGSEADARRIIRNLGLRLFEVGDGLSVKVQPRYREISVDEWNRENIEEFYWTQGDREIADALNEFPIIGIEESGDGDDR
jgi:hypothetical protein